MVDNTEIAYCTVVAQNYLPQALALYSSIQRQTPDISLTIMVIDGDRADLETTRPNLRVVGLDFLKLAASELTNLTAIYDVVEFATAIKPIFFLQLLDTYSRVAYLDPDTYVVSPMEELPEVIDDYGIVFTPHFLNAISPESEIVSEVHSLTVGVHNLGFGAFGQQSRPFLEWWWMHLRRECLIYPLLSLFVDQKWTDIGAVLFEAHSWKNPGYNVGPWNLHERFIVKTNDSLRIESTDQPLRLVHFSGFNPHDPDAISIRLSVSLRGADGASDEFRNLSREYAEEVLRARSALGTLPAYKWGVDSAGRVISKRRRMIYRRELLESESTSLPSPFDQTQRREYDRWRRRSLATGFKLTLADVAIAAKYALPDEFQLIKRRLPGPFMRVRSDLLQSSRVRR